MHLKEYIFYVMFQKTQDSAPMRYLALLLIMVYGAASAQSNNDRAVRDELVFMRDQDPVMQRAFEKARSNLDDFLHLAMAAPANLTGFAVKVAITDISGTEFFWIGPFEASADQFTGVINNDPLMVKTVKVGQRYSFHRSRIVDWRYIDRSTQKMFGNFGLCALLTMRSKEDADATKRHYNLDCKT